jgi:glycosyltransferase involved in cell wall biosynthesis
VRQVKILNILLRRWFQIAKDAYRARPPEPAWRSLTCTIGTVLHLATLRAAARVARILVRPGLSASLIAKSDSVGGSGFLLSPMSRVYPWFHLESFESGLARADYPSVREGYSLRVCPLAKPLWFEFESDTASSALKLPLWATSKARARIEVLEMSESGLLPIFQGVRAIALESPDASLSIPLSCPNPEKFYRRFRVQIVPALLGHRGYLNFFATDHPATLRLESFPAEPVPSISIVTLLYGKERECPEFVRALHELNYPGHVEVIAIDDDSPDNSSHAFQEAISRLHEEYPEAAKRIRWSLTKNPINLGNCASRNSGLSQVSGDLVFVMDCDCIPNRTFLLEHAHSHIRHNADVVIGLHNIESGFQPVTEVLELLEADNDSRARRADLQDPINPVSFLNCVTRNFSFRKAYLSHIHFDEAFGYSRAKDSGFGWEDIELGYKLYLTGARMVFNPHAFTVHISHPPNSDPSDLPLRSEKNLARLISKHPELSLIARRWLTHTIERLQQWRQAENLKPTETSEALAAIIAEAPSILAPRKLRILTYRWHPAHQYEIYKTGHRFDLVRSSDERLTSFSRQWEYGQRPLPANAGFIELDQINFDDYDLALLHFDENVLDWQNTNNVLCNNWGASFRYFMEFVPLPKVAICHGTPQFHGMYTFGYEGQDLLNEIDGTRQRLVDYLGNTLVICNSHQARAEWRFQNSRVIWHGFDPTEFPESRRAKGILTLGRAMKERPHYRGYYFFEGTLKGFPVEHHPSALKVEEPDYPNCRLGNEYARAKFRNYVDAIREYSIYFNPTLRSPMPRSRGEAMMCGLVSVSARNHDVDQYIVNGRNGFHAETPEEARDYLLYLVNHPEACARMGHASRQTALDVFNHDRFMSEWQSIFTALAR